jgi:hypothetical protein
LVVIVVPPVHGRDWQREQQRALQRRQPWERERAAPTRQRQQLARCEPVEEGERASQDHRRWQRQRQEGEDDEQGVDDGETRGARLQARHYGRPDEDNGRGAGDCGGCCGRWWAGGLTDEGEERGWGRRRHGCGFLVVFCSYRWAGGRERREVYFLRDPRSLAAVHAALRGF